ncbi:MAG: Rne/Rng family ribonuclease [Deltaproteobacteria bacterium]|nr:Rne/Rng family ribonuclease [Deltaproteobacteria bacterium]MBI4196658.1 Rne/Rng family ribonuclease [Deltaproteobacteria bacterium]
MKNELIINISPTLTRIARLEGGAITELIVERAQEARFVGNVYKGKIVRVLPGMQAAFAEIGLKRTAFLYVSDIAPDLAVEEVMAEEEEPPPERPRFDRRHPRTLPQIQELVREGQEIIVQIARDPIGTKGARLTSHVSLPGRFLVYMPTVKHVGVSRRIADDNDRSRLKGILERIVPRDQGGFIARTMSEGASERELKQDMDYLIKLWGDILSSAEKVSAPNLVHQELSAVLRAIRDLFTPDIDRIVIDSAEEKKKIEEFISSFTPLSHNIVTLYDGSEPIFDAYGIEVEISRALGKKVWLKSGGYIIIDQAEALTAIDVNTGKFVGRSNLEDTILKTNLEAAKEIAYQLRLRDIGGILIVDFIDMERPSNREKVFQAFREYLRSDRAKTTITKITDLGLVEMTRKRTRESLGRLLCEPCFYCEGRGYLKSRATICHEIFRELQRGLADLRGDTLIVLANPSVAEILLDEERPTLEQWEERAGKKVIIRAREDYHTEQFDITDRG